MHISTIVLRLNMIIQKYSYVTENHTYKNILLMKRLMISEVDLVLKFKFNVEL